jgi:hypothetical protein
VSTDANALPFAATLAAEDCIFCESAAAGAAREGEALIAVGCVRVVVVQLIQNVYLEATGALRALGYMVKDTITVMHKNIGSLILCAE